MNIFRRIFRWVAGVVLGLLLILVAALYFILSDKTLTRFANRFADELVTVDSNVGNVHLELLKNYPLSRISIDDVYVADGQDTLTAIDGLRASIDIREVLKGYYIIPEVSLSGVRANVVYYSDSTSNLGVFRFPASDAKSGTNRSGGLSNFRLGDARLEGNNKVSYRDYRSGMMVSLDGIEVEASASKGVDEWERPRRRSPRRPTSFAIDSIPDFLSESDFRKSDISFDMDSTVSGFIREWHPKGKFKVRKGTVIIPSFPLRNNIAGLDAGFDGNSFDLHSLGVKSGSSQLILSGELKDVLRLFSKQHSMVNINLMVNAKRLNINEILAALQVGSKTDAESVDTAAFLGLDEQLYEESVVVDLEDAEPELRTPLIVVPSNVIADITIGASTVNISTFDIDSLAARIKMQERTLQLSDVRALSPMGGIALDAYYATRTKQDISAGFDLGLNDVTAEKVIDLIPSVDEVLPMLKSFSGKLDCRLTATAQMDTNMRFKTPSLDGVFSIRGKDLRLDDMGKIKPIVQYLLFGRRDFRHVDHLYVSGSVKDSKLEILPFDLTVDKYTMALSGTQNFDKSFSYHVSMLKAPIPIRFGVNLFGNDFSKVRFRLGRSAYKKVEMIPDYSEEVEAFRSELSDNIRNVFRGNYGIPSHSDRMLAYVSGGEDEGLSYEEMMEIELMLIEMDIEEESALLDDEIDALIANIL